MRYWMVGMGCPTDPSLRRESSPRSTQVIGEVSVWPKTATLSARGKASPIARSVLSLAGAAPQLMIRSLRSRLSMSGCAQMRSHCWGTLKTTVAPSAS